MGIFLGDFPKTEEGKKLNLDEELKKELIVVYRKTAEKEDWEFFGLKDDSEEYLEDDIFVPVESVYVGNEEVFPDTPFVNVIGSTRDPRPAPSWIKLMNLEYKRAGWKEEFLKHCCTDGNYYNSKTHRRIVVDKKCSKRIVGGHVLLNKTVNQETQKGDTIYLLPICSTHNVSKLNGHRTGAFYYMKNRYKILAVKLKHFLMKAQVEPYLNQDSHSEE